jgi:DNA-binding NtrC family response regulator
MDVLSELPLRVEPVMIRQDLLPSARSARAFAVIVDWWASGRELDSRLRQELMNLGREAPTILLSDQPWTRTMSADDLGLVCILDLPFDVDEVQYQVRRCLERVA